MPLNVFNLSESWLCVIWLKKKNSSKWCFYTHKEPQETHTDQEKKTILFMLSERKASGNICVLLMYALKVL